MSLEAIERIFWEIGDDKAKADAFLSDPEGYASRYPLTAEERRMVLSLDVPALASYGVSPMLTMAAFTLAKGGGDLLIFDYLKALNGGRMINRMRIPGPAFAGLRVALAGRSALVGLRRRLSGRKF